MLCEISVFSLQYPEMSYTRLNVKSEKVDVLTENIFHRGPNLRKHFFY